MKRITITYRMSRPGEDAENCITVPMSEENAAAVLSQRKDMDGKIGAEIAGLLGAMAYLAGYDGVSCVGVEMAAQQYERTDI